MYKKYIFIDESGDLGQKGSKFLVLAALMINEPKHLNRLVKRARGRFKRQLKKANELKANNSSVKIRNYILTKTNELPKVSIFFIVLEKKQLTSLYLRNNKHKLYNYVAGKLAGYLPLNNDAVQIRIDLSKGKQLLQKDFNDYFISKLNPKNNPDNVSITHSYSQNWAGLQIVDFLAWACFQKFERGDSSYINLLNIQNEAFLVW